MAVKAVGIELEGGWLKPPEGTILTHDVSVVAPKSFVVGSHHWGEAVSPVLKPGDVEKWVRHNYPTHIPAAQNIGSPQERSCGLHIHVSFDEVAEYRATVQKTYHKWLLDGFEKWGMANLLKKDIFWHRWLGKNRFCTRDFTPHSQMKWKEKGHNREDRRRHLNYTWGYLGTVEWRMLPMFPDALLRPEHDERVKPGDIDLAVGSVETFLTLTNLWLQKIAGEEKEKEILHKSLLFAQERPVPQVIEQEFTQKRRQK